MGHETIDFERQAVERLDVFCVTRLAENLQQPIEDVLDQLLSSSRQGLRQPGTRGAEPAGREKPEPDPIAVEVHERLLLAIVVIERTTMVWQPGKSRVVFRAFHLPSKVAVPRQHGTA